MSKEIKHEIDPFIPLHKFADLICATPVHGVLNMDMLRTFLHLLARQFGVADIELEFFGADGRHVVKLLPLISQTDELEIYDLQDASDVSIMYAEEMSMVPDLMQIPKSKARHYRVHSTGKTRAAFITESVLPIILTDDDQEEEDDYAYGLDDEFDVDEPGAITKMWNLVNLPVRLDNVEKSLEALKSMIEQFNQVLKSECLGKWDAFADFLKRLKLLERILGLDGLGPSIFDQIMEDMANKLWEMFKDQIRCKCSMGDDDDDFQCFEPGQLDSEMLACNVVLAEKVNEMCQFVKKDMLNELEKLKERNFHQIAEMKTRLNEILAELNEVLPDIKAMAKAKVDKECLPRIKTFVEEKCEQFQGYLYCLDEVVCKLEELEYQKAVLGRQIIPCPCPKSKDVKVDKTAKKKLPCQVHEDVEDKKKAKLHELKKNRVCDGGEISPRENIPSMNTAEEMVQFLCPSPVHEFHCDKNIMKGTTKSRKNVKDTKTFLEFKK